MHNSKERRAEDRRRFSSRAQRDQVRSDSRAHGETQSRILIHHQSTAQSLPNPFELGTELKFAHPRTKLRGDLHSVDTRPTSSTLCPRPC